MNKVDFNDLALVSVETLNAFDIVTGEWLFCLDELQNITLGNTEEEVEIVGRAGRLLNVIKRNKAMTVNGANGLVSGGLLMAQTGGEATYGATDVHVPDMLRVENDEATTTYKAVGTPGNEIAYVIVKDASGFRVQTLEQDAAVAPGKFTYDPATKKLAFDAGELADGTNIAVYYKRKIKANVLTNLSDKYSTKAYVVVDVMAEDKCNRIFHVQYVIPSASFVGNFELGVGDSQTVHNFEAKSIASACHGASKYWDMIVFDDDAADEP